MLKFYPATGRFLATDAATAATMFDTDTPSLYTPPANVFSGSASIPARSATSAGFDGVQETVDLTADYYVGAPNIASANIVRGLISYDGSLWRQAYGSHLKEMDGVANTTFPQTDNVSKLYLTTLQTFTPMVNNLGHVVIRERTIIRQQDPGSPPAITRTLPAFTLQYRLVSDFWWGNPIVTPRSDIQFVGLRGDQFYGTTNITLTSVNIGYAYPGRRVICYVGANITSATIGGVAATIHQTAGGATWISAVVPTGESVTFTAVSASTLNGIVQVFTMAARGLTGTITTAKATSATNSVTLTPTVGSSQAAVLFAFGTSTYTWTNATASGSVNVAIIETNSSVPITATGNAGTTLSMFSAVIS